MRKLYIMTTPSIVILPAAKELFNSNKVTLKQIANQFKDGVIYCFEKPNGQIHYVFSSGDMNYSIGDKFVVIHDQTRIKFNDGKEWTLVGTGVIAADTQNQDQFTVVTENMADKKPVSRFLSDWSNQCSLN